MGDCPNAGGVCTVIQRTILDFDLIQSSGQPILTLSYVLTLLPQKHSPNPTHVTQAHPALGPAR
jgi:hypothetical protein